MLSLSKSTSVLAFGVPPGTLPADKQGATIYSGYFPVQLNKNTNAFHEGDCLEACEEEEKCAAYQWQQTY